MEFTNKYDLPKYVVDWLTYDNYDYEEGTISATGLMSPPRQYALKSKYKEELKMDCSDLIAARYGTAIHSGFEVVPMVNVDKEKRMYKEIVVGKEIIKLSGKPDIILNINLPEQKLVDIKSTSVWGYILGSKAQDYQKQLSIYRYLAKYSGYNITEAEVCMIFTDWSKTRAKEKDDYPQTRIKVMPIILWSIEETEKYILERLSILMEAKNTHENCLPYCTEEELWRKPTEYKVMITGGKKATRICDSEEFATNYIQSKGLINAYILKKVHQAKRCGYCNVRPFCKQYKEMLENDEVE